LTATPSTGYSYSAAINPTEASEPTGSAPTDGCNDEWYWWVLCGVLSFLLGLILGAAAGAAGFAAYQKKRMGYQNIGYDD